MKRKLLYFGIIVIAICLVGAVAMTFYACTTPKDNGQTVTPDHTPAVPGDDTPAGPGGEVTQAEVPYGETTEFSVNPKVGADSFVLSWQGMHYAKMRLYSEQDEVEILIPEGADQVELAFSKSLQFDLQSWQGDEWHSVSTIVFYRKDTLNVQKTLVGAAVKGQTVLSWGKSNQAQDATFEVLYRAEGEAETRTRTVGNSVSLPLVAGKEYTVMCRETDKVSVRDGDLYVPYSYWSQPVTVVQLSDLAGFEYRDADGNIYVEKATGALGYRVNAYYDDPSNPFFGRVVKEMPAGSAGKVALPFDTSEIDRAFTLQVEPKGTDNMVSAGRLVVSPEQVAEARITIKEPVSVIAEDVDAFVWDSIEGCTYNVRRTLNDNVTDTLSLNVASGRQVRFSDFEAGAYVQLEVKPIYQQANTFSHWTRSHRVYVYDELENLQVNKNGNDIIFSWNPKGVGVSYCVTVLNEDGSVKYAPNEITACTYAMGDPRQEGRYTVTFSCSKGAYSLSKITSEEVEKLPMPIVVRRHQVANVEFDGHTYSDYMEIEFLNREEGLVFSSLTPEGGVPLLTSMMDDKMWVYNSATYATSQQSDSTYHLGLYTSAENDVHKWSSELCTIDIKKCGSVAASDIRVGANAISWSNADSFSYNYTFVHDGSVVTQKSDVTGDKLPIDSLSAGTYEFTLWRNGGDMNMNGNPVTIRFGKLATPTNLIMDNRYTLRWANSANAEWSGNTQNAYGYVVSLKANGTQNFQVLDVIRQQVEYDLSNETGILAGVNTLSVYCQGRQGDGATDKGWLDSDAATYDVYRMHAITCRVEGGILKYEAHSSDRSYLTNYKVCYRDLASNVNDQDVGTDEALNLLGEGRLADALRGSDDVDDASGRWYLWVVVQGQYNGVNAFPSQQSYKSVPNDRWEIIKLQQPVLSYFTEMDTAKGYRVGKMRISGEGNGTREDLAYVRTKDGYSLSKRIGLVHDGYDLEANDGIWASGTYDVTVQAIGNLSTTLHSKVSNPLTVTKQNAPGYTYAYDVVSPTITANFGTQVNEASIYAPKYLYRLDDGAYQGETDTIKNVYTIVGSDFLAGIHYYRTRLLPDAEQNLLGSEESEYDFYKLHALSVDMSCLGDVWDSKAYQITWNSTDADHLGYYSRYNVRIAAEGMQYAVADTIQTGYKEGFDSMASGVNGTLTVRALGNTPQRTIDADDVDFTFYKATTPNAHYEDDYLYDPVQWGVTSGRPAGMSLDMHYTVYLDGGVVESDNTNGCYAPPTRKDGTALLSKGDHTVGVRTNGQVANRIVPSDVCSVELYKMQRPSLRFADDEVAWDAIEGVHSSHAYVVEVWNSDGMSLSAVRAVNGEDELVYTLRDILRTPAPADYIVHVRAVGVGQDDHSLVSDDAIYHVQRLDIVGEVTADAKLVIHPKAGVTYVYRVDDGSWTEWSAEKDNVLHVSYGAHTVYVQATKDITDGVGFLTGYATYNIYQLHVVGSVSADADLCVTQDDGAAYRYRVDQGDRKNTQGLHTALDVLSEGAHVIHVYATRTAGSNVVYLDASADYDVYALKVHAAVSADGYMHIDRAVGVTYHYCYDGYTDWTQVASDDTLLSIPAGDTRSVKIRATRAAEGGVVYLTDVIAISVKQLSITGNVSADGVMHIDREAGVSYRYREDGGAWIAITRDDTTPAAMSAGVNHTITVEAAQDAGGVVYLTTTTDYVVYPLTVSASVDSEAALSVSHSVEMPDGIVLHYYLDGTEMNEAALRTALTSLSTGIIHVVDVVVTKAAAGGVVYLTSAVQCKVYRLQVAATVEVWGELRIVSASDVLQNGDYAYALDDVTYSLANLNAALAALAAGDHTLVVGVSHTGEGVTYVSNSTSVALTKLAVVGSVAKDGLHLTRQDNIQYTYYSDNNDETWHEIVADTTTLMVGEGAHEVTVVARRAADSRVYLTATATYSVYQLAFVAAIEEGRVVIQSRSAVLTNGDMSYTVAGKTYAVTAALPDLDADTYTVKVQATKDAAGGVTYLDVAHELTYHVVQLVLDVEVQAGKVVVVDRSAVLTDDDITYTVGGHSYAITAALPDLAKGTYTVTAQATKAKDGSYTYLDVEATASYVVEQLVLAIKVSEGQVVITDASSALTNADVTYTVAGETYAVTDALPDLEAGTYTVTATGAKAKAGNRAYLDVTATATYVVAQLELEAEVQGGVIVVTDGSDVLTDEDITYKVGSTVYSIDTPLPAMAAGEYLLDVTAAKSAASNVTYLAVTIQVTYTVEQLSVTAAVDDKGVLTVQTQGDVIYRYRVDDGEWTTMNTAQADLSAHVGAHTVTVQATRNGTAAVTYLMGETSIDFEIEADPEE